jgi:hypothetical protein
MGITKRNAVRQQGSTKRSQTRKRIEERKEEEKGRRSI